MKKKRKINWVTFTVFMIYDLIAILPLISYGITFSRETSGIFGIIMSLLEYNKDTEGAKTFGSILGGYLIIFIVLLLVIFLCQLFLSKHKKSAIIWGILISVINIYSYITFSSSSLKNYVNQNSYIKEVIFGILIILSAIFGLKIQNKFSKKENENQEQINNNNVE